MTINKLILAGVFAVLAVPQIASAQEAKPADAMMSSTADTTGNYTIVRRSVGQMQNDSDNSSGVTSSTANTNTDIASIQRTISANPGLSEALQKEGVKVDEIGAISVQPNGQVVIYDRT